MSRHHKKKRSKKVGLPPGTLIHIGEEKTASVRMTIIDYDETSVQMKEAQTVEECLRLKDTPTTSWINIDGIHQLDVIENIGKHYAIHPLILEDIVNTEQRPKVEDLKDYLFIIVKMITYDEKEHKIKSEQVSLILGQHYVLSFQESLEGDVFEPVRERIRDGIGRIRKMGTDYLVYSLLDAVVDNYFLVMEKLGEEIEVLEEELIERPTPQISMAIHKLKREMIFLRKSVWPIREVINFIERRESALIHESTVIYLKDLYDHTIQVIETVEAFRDILAGMIEIYLSSISNRMNEVIIRLSIIATIFIPLTFLAGVYGMNFKYMPEIGSPWGYPLFWLVVISVSVFMLVYFRKRNWF